MPEYPDTLADALAQTDPNAEEPVEVALDCEKAYTLGYATKEWHYDLKTRKRENTRVDKWVNIQETVETFISDIFYSLNKISFDGVNGLYPDLTSERYIVIPARHHTDADLLNYTLQEFYVFYKVHSTSLVPADLDFYTLIMWRSFIWTSEIRSAIRSKQFTDPNFRFEFDFKEEPPLFTRHIKIENHHLADDAEYDIFFIPITGLLFYELQRKRFMPTIGRHNAFHSFREMLRQTDVFEELKKRQITKGFIQYF